MGGRSFIAAWVEAKRDTLAGLSAVAKRNDAYIQQFMTRGVPSELPEVVRERLAAHFGISANALREGDRSEVATLPARGSDVVPAPNVLPPEPRRLALGAKAAVLGIVEAGSDEQFMVNLTDGPMEEVDLPAALVGVPDIFALFVAGESMAGIWQPGDTVFVSRRRPVTPGCFVVVEVSTGPDDPSRMFLKQFVSKSDDTIRLVQHNPYMDLKVPAKQVKHMWRALHWREWAA